MNNHSDNECQNCKESNKEYKKIKLDNSQLTKKILNLESQIHSLNSENKKLKKEIEVIKQLNYDSIDEYFE